MAHVSAGPPGIFLDPQGVYFSKICPNLGDILHIQDPPLGIDCQDFVENVLQNSILIELLFAILIFVIFWITVLF